MTRFFSIPSAFLVYKLFQWIAAVSAKSDSMNCGSGLNGVGYCGNSSISVTEQFLMIPAFLLLAALAIATYLFLIGAFGPEKLKGN